MPLPPYEHGLGSLLGRGQAGVTGIQQSVDRGRDAGTRNPRTGQPWPAASVAGGWNHQSGELVTSTGSTISAASFGDVSPPASGVTGIGVLSVRFRDPVVDTPAWSTEVDEVFDAFRLYGFLPYGWGRVVPTGSDARRGGQAYVTDSGGNASPIVFPVSGATWPASYTTGLTNGTSDVVATYDLWTPST